MCAERRVPEDLADEVSCLGGFDPAEAAPWRNAMGLWLRLSVMTPLVEGYR